MWQRSGSRLAPTGLLVLLTGAAARADEPVRLPAGEDPAAWAEPLRLARLAVGAPGEGPWVEIVAGGASWTVRVRDARGRIQEASVAPPRSEQAREDLALLARSLLQPTSSASWDDVGALPPRARVAGPPEASSAAPTSSVATTPPVAARVAPSRPGPPSGATPAPAPAEPRAPARAQPQARSAPSDPAGTSAPEPPSPWGVPASAPPTPSIATLVFTPPDAAPTGASSAPALVPATPTVVVPAPSPAVRWWGQAGGAFAWRPETALAGAVGAAGGVAVGPALRLGAALEWSPDRALATLGEDRGVTALDVLGGGSWAFLRGERLAMGVQGGVSVRPYDQDGLTIATTVIPLAVLTASAHLPVGGPVTLVPYLDARVDLRRTELRIGEETVDDLPVVELRVGLRIDLREID